MLGSRRTQSTCYLTSREDLEKLHNYSRFCFSNHFHLRLKSNYLGILANKRQTKHSREAYKQPTAALQPSRLEPLDALPSPLNLTCARTAAPGGRTRPASESLQAGGSSRSYRTASSPRQNARRRTAPRRAAGGAWRALRP